MKNLPLISKTETFEDIVFEGRNKSYGAYDLNNKRRKYLIIAFLFSLTGVSTAVAVPFLRQLGGSGTLLPPDKRVIIQIDPIHNDPLDPPPPPPPLPDAITNPNRYVPYEVVEDAPPETEIMTNDELAELTHNPLPIPLEIVPVQDNNGEIDEPVEETFTNPQEPAGFMGGDVGDFRNWVAEHITYPADAIEVGIFGRVTVEFCVNANGDVVDIRILRQLDPLIDRETLRVISSSPRWTPAKQGGKPVKQRFVIPFMFNMQ